MVGKISKVKNKAEALILNEMTVMQKYTTNQGFITSVSHILEGLDNGWVSSFITTVDDLHLSLSLIRYMATLSISEIKMANISDVDLSRLEVTKFGILL